MLTQADWCCLQLFIYLLPLTHFFYILAHQMLLYLVWCAGAQYRAILREFAAINFVKQHHFYFCQKYVRSSDSHILTKGWCSCFLNFNNSGEFVNCRVCLKLCNARVWRPKDYLQYNSLVICIFSPLPHCVSSLLCLFLAAPPFSFFLSLAWNSPSRLS